MISFPFYHARLLHLTPQFFAQSLSQHSHVHPCLCKSSINQLTGSPQSSRSWICKAETVSILTHNEKMQVIHSCSQQQKLQPVARAMTSRRAFRPITHQAQGAWYLPMTDRYNEHRLNAWRQSDRTSTRSSIPVAPAHTETRQPHCSFTSLHRFSSCFFFARIQMFSFTSTIESTLHPARMRLSFYAHFLLHFLTISRACYCVWIVALLFLVKIRHHTCCFPLLTSQQRQMPLDQ